MGGNRLYELVGQRIQTLRRERGFTQSQLADAVSMTRTSITNLEHGRQGVVLQTLYDLAEALKVEPADLLPSMSELHLPLSRKPKATTEADGLKDFERRWVESLIADRKGGE